MPPMLPVSDKSQDGFGSGKTGQWDKRLWTDLEVIARRTPNTASGKRQIEVDLIPDVWARLILFSNALYDENHLLHKNAIAAFRGFLAVLALRTRKGMAIKAEELLLNAYGTWPLAVAARNSADGSRHGIHQLYPDTSWNAIYLLRGEGGSLLAITSPLTLICPAQGPAMTGLKALPSSWFDGAQFRDPSVAGVLNDEDRQLLAAWLKNLRGNLARHGSESAQVVSWSEGQNRLLRTISHFEDDLTRDQVPAAQLGEGVLRLGASAYRYLGAPLRQEEIRLEHSDLLLDSPLPPAPVLLALRASDKDVAIEPYADPNKITVVSGTSLLDINIAVWGDNRRILAGRALPGEAEWIDPKTLFLDRLYLLKGTQQRSGMNHARGQREVADQLSEYPVMPFSQRLAELLPAGQIVQNVRFAVENHGNGNVVVVKLRLPIKSGKSIEITRSYTTEQQTSMQQIPVLEVWPPFRKKGWNLYSTFWWSNSESAFSAEPFPISPGGRLEEQTESLSGGQQVRVTRLNAVPEGFFLRHPHPQRGQAAMQEAGIIFNKLTEIIAPPKGVWTAGVDFGTSSTNVVLRAGQDHERALVLAQSGPLRIVVGRDADRPEALYKYFLPFTPESEGAAETSPFLSFLRMRHPEQTSFNAISGAHILFYSRSHNIQELSAGRLATDLKWEGVTRGRSRPYLQQVCLQTAAEAAIAGAEKINWFYSLPAAFNPHRRDDYRREWRSIAAFVAEETGLGSTHEPVSMTESFATARYFTEREEAPPVVGAAFLDIGGGTTDISVWQENTERCGVSLKFAGRDLFLAPLFQLRSRLLPEFASIAPERVSEATVSRLIADQSETEFFAHAEAMLRDAGVSLAQKLHLQDKLETPALPLRFGMAGLFYYLGIVLRHLEMAGLYKRDLGGVFLGGNGAQLLHWADGGQYDPSGSFARLLTDSLFSGAKWTDSAPRNVQIKLSAKPKQEAATGLVVTSSLRSNAEHWDDLIAGEPFSIGGVPKSETNLVSREEMSQVELAGLPQLEVFYDKYFRMAEKIGYPRTSLRKEELFARATERVRQFLADQRNKPSEDMDLTPPFIKGLQALIIGIARDAEKSRGTGSGR